MRLAAMARWLGAMLVALLLAAGCGASAQEPAEPQDPAAVTQSDATDDSDVAPPEVGVAASQRGAVADVAHGVASVERRMLVGVDDDAMLVQLRGELDDLSRAIQGVEGTLRGRLGEIDGRLTEIGAPPGDGEQAEPDSLTQERAGLRAERSQINGMLGETESLTQQINGLRSEISQIRRDRFMDGLSERYDLRTALSPAVLSEFAAEISRLDTRIRSWLRFIRTERPWQATLATLLALAAATALLIGGRRAFAPLRQAAAQEEQPSDIARLSVAFWSTLLPSAALCMFLFGTYALYSALGLLRVDIGRLMWSGFTVIAIVFFVHRLSDAVFSPRRPEWRLWPITSRAAWLLVWLVGLTALASGADFFLRRLNEVMASPLALTVFNSFVATLIVGILVVLIGLVKPFAAADGTARRWPRAFRWSLYVLGAGTILAALMGYVGLARFISQQIVVTGAILATMYIGHRCASAISDAGALSDSAAGRRLTDWFGAGEGREEQFSLFAGLFINVLVLAIGVPLILLTWGFQWGDLQDWVYDLATEIRIGSISISIVGILTGLAIFLIGYFATRSFQRWLDGRVMTRGRVDAGVRNSIATIIGYAGVALAALFGLSVAGLDLSNLALVAGALSVGIGFGLQNIVNNFVSGLILLAERPFKVGDWIVAGDVEGTVRKISVRATEVETFQRQTVILPNSDLINSRVRNWTHRNRLGRIDIPVSVGADCEPRRVHDLLLDIARTQPSVLKNPSPFVALTEMTPLVLNFSLRFYLADIGNQLSTTNEIRFRIVEALRREGIK